MQLVENSIWKMSLVENFQIYDNGEVADEGFRELWVTNPDYESITMDSTAASLVDINNMVSISDINQDEYFEKINSMEHFTQMTPIMNDEKCQACHQPPAKGSPLYASQKDKWKVRSVVKVSTSMADIHEEINKNTESKNRVKGLRAQRARAGTAANPN